MKIRILAVLAATLGLGSTELTTLINTETVFYTEVVKRTGASAD
jgi:hypothetical protein